MPQFLMSVLLSAVGRPRRSWADLPEAEADEFVSTSPADRQAMLERMRMLVSQLGDPPQTAGSKKPNV